MTACIFGEILVLNSLQMVAMSMSAALKNLLVYYFSTACPALQTGIYKLECSLYILASCASKVDLDLLF